MRRVLVAVDLTRAAPPTLAAAERYAALFGAELRALSVVEPLFFLPEVPQPDTTDYYRHWEETLAHDVWPLIRAPGVETLVRHGTALEAILREAAEWRADLLVVGSHGKGRVKRTLVGSVTEGLINHLPTSLLVVPAAAAPEGLSKSMTSRQFIAGHPRHHELAGEPARRLRVADRAAHGPH